MRNILLLAHDDPGQEARFQAALDVARAIDGHLTCIDVCTLPIPLIDAFSQAGLHLAADETRARETMNRKRLIERLKVEGVPYDWIGTTGGITSMLRQNAAVADMIVLNPRLHASSPRMDHIVADVLVQTRKPILAVPERHASLQIAGARAMAAWDGSDEAVRALAAATPLLRHAASVTIVEICQGAAPSTAEDAAIYLSRHGIKPAILRLNGEDDYVPPLLLAQARTMRADYIVMGGFGHWRLTEHLFRGNTHWLLGASHTPLFLAH